MVSFSLLYVRIIWNNTKEGPESAKPLAVFSQNADPNDRHVCVVVVKNSTSERVERARVGSECPPSTFAERNTSSECLSSS